MYNETLTPVWANLVKALSGQVLNPTIILLCSRHQFQIDYPQIKYWTQVTDFLSYLCRVLFVNIWIYSSSADQGFGHHCDHKWWRHETFSALLDLCKRSPPMTDVDLQRASNAGFDVSSLFAWTDFHVTSLLWDILVSSGASPSTYTVLMRKIDMIGFKIL